MRDEYSTFGWVIERMLTDVGFTLVGRLHAPLHGTYLREPKPVTTARQVIARLDRHDAVEPRATPSVAEALMPACRSRC